MNNIVENVIAAIIVGALATAIVLLLRAFGLSTQMSVNVALFALPAFAVIILVSRNLSPSVTVVQSGAIR